MCFTRATKTLYLKLLLHRKQKADTKVQELHFDFTQQEVNTLRNQWKPIDCQQLEKSECLDSGCHWGTEEKRVQTWSKEPRFRSQRAHSCF